MNIPADVNYILVKLIKSGFKAYVVGGCVRDSLLQKKPSDWDITTDATPVQVKQIFSRTYDTGLKHGTVTIIHNSTSVEVTTFRTESDYADHRHPSKVDFTKNIYEDLKRRDFTINAIAYNDEHGYIDPHNGIDDIKARVIRGVGNAVERFNEDALRMLRAVRFSAQLSFAVETNTYNAILQSAPLIAKISSERISEEICKTLTSNNPEKIFLLEELTLLKYILPEISIKQYEHTINEQLNISFNYLPLRLFILFQYSDEPVAVAALKRLKLENKVIDVVRFFYKYRNVQLLPESVEIKKILSQTNEERFLGILHLQTVLSNTIEPIEVRQSVLNNIYETEQIFKDIIAAKECFCLKDLAVNGNDLKRLGIKGVAIGSALNRLLDIVIKDNSLNSYEKLIDIASSFD